MKRVLTITMIAVSLATAQAAPPSDQSIEQMMKALQLETLIGQTLTQMDTALKSGVEQGLKSTMQGKELTPAQRTALEKCQQKLSAAMKEEMSLAKTKDVYVQAYRETFTQDEINSIIAFYSSPGGKAMVDKLPAAMQKAGALMQARMEPLMKRIETMQADCSKEIGDAK